MLCVCVEECTARLRSCKLRLCSVYDCQLRLSGFHKHSVYLTIYMRTCHMCVIKRESIAMKVIMYASGGRVPVPCGGTAGEVIMNNQGLDWKLRGGVGGCRQHDKAHATGGSRAAAGVDSRCQLCASFGAAYVAACVLADQEDLNRR